MYWQILMKKLQRSINLIQAKQIYLSFLTNFHHQIITNTNRCIATNAVWYRAAPLALALLYGNCPLIVNMSFLTISYYFTSTLSENFYTPMTHINSFHLIFWLTRVISSGTYEHGYTSFSDIWVINNLI